MVAVRTSVRALLRFDFEGNLRWVIPIGRSDGSIDWQSELALDGERIWIGGGYRATPEVDGSSLGNVTRLDSSGRPDFSLELGSRPTSVQARGGHVWATTRLRSPFVYTIAPPEPSRR